jgi:hypothetical protein
MKKLGALSILAVVTSSFVPLASTGAAQAQSTGAFVAQDLSCGSYIPDTDSTLSEDYVTTSDGHQTTSASGNLSLLCHFIIPAGDALSGRGQAVGFPCQTYLGLTYNTQVTVSSAGNMTLICKILLNKPYP